MNNQSEISTKQGNRIKSKASWFCGTTHCPADIENIKKHITEFQYYAYIMHDSDLEDSSNHIHFIINITGSRSIKSISETLCCDYGDVQVLKHVRSYHRYLLHLDSEEKVKYDPKMVITNQYDRFIYNLDGTPSDSRNLFTDYRELKLGRISAEEFIEKYRGEFANMSFYQKIRIYGELTNL